MTTSARTSIEPQFRAIDGLEIRFAESAPREEHALLRSRGLRASARSTRCGTGSASTCTWSPWTFLASGIPRAGTR